MLNFNRLGKPAVSSVESVGFVYDERGVFFNVPAECMIESTLKDSSGREQIVIEFCVSFEAMEKMRERLNRQLPGEIKKHREARIRKLKQELAILTNDPSVTFPEAEFNDGSEIPQAADAPETGSGTGTP